MAVGHILVEVDRYPVLVIHMVAGAHGIVFSLQGCRNIGCRLQIAKVEHLDIDKAEPFVADREYQQVAVVVVVCLFGKASSL